MDQVLVSKEKTKRTKIHEDAVTERKRNDNDLAMRREVEETKRQAEEHRHEEKKSKQENIPILLSFGMLILVILLAFAWGEYDEYKTKQETNKHIANGEIQMSASADDLHGRDYQDVQRDFESAGFTNVFVYPGRDLVTGFITHDGSVESVSIAGDQDFSESDWFSSDAPVRITYHTYKDSD